MDPYQLPVATLANMHVSLPVIHNAGYEEQHGPWEFPTAKHKGNIPIIRYHEELREYHRALPFHYVMMVIQGAAQFRFDDTACIAEENDIIHIPRHQFHHIQAVQLPMRYVWLHYNLYVPDTQETILPPSPVEQEQAYSGMLAMREVRPALPVMFRPGNTQLIRRLFVSAANEALMEEPGWLPASQSYLQALLIMLLREATAGEKHTAIDLRDDSLAAVLEHIHLAYADKLTTGQLAKLANLSPNYFITRFKLATGFTPGEYVARVRISQAKKLIRNGLQTLSQIAHEAGFDNLAYFSRVFKKIEGISPSEYKHNQLG